ncbi:MAG: IclR family transcriptional regulator [Actinobacteria bacterium]|nr:MAG: IclR family transcriptional regulator [Actinomycetota bacterium]
MSPRRSTRTRRLAWGRSRDKEGRTTSAAIALCATLCQDPQRRYLRESHASTIISQNRCGREGHRAARHTRRRGRARDERARTPNGHDSEHRLAPAPTGRYRLGLRIVQLANALLARLDVRAVARPHLEELVRVTGETATLSVPGEEDAVTIDFVSGSHQIQPVSRLGRPSVAYATSAGKVMLAFSGRTLPAEPYRAYTPRTITDSKALVREIERVRERGYAQAIEEREPGLSAIAVPVRSSRGELDAIVALQGPSSRFDKKAIGAALPVLLEQGRAISRELGWRAD